MNESALSSSGGLALPSNVVSKGDISRLVSEVERVDDELTTQDVRSKAGADDMIQPVISDQLTLFLRQNQLSLESSHDRSELISRLRELKNKVPVLHMTFAVEADRESLQELVGWIRAEIHPEAVIEVGLQPALVAGVYLRTPNHVHDLSLRGLLDGRHDILTQQLEALRGNQ